MAVCTRDRPDSLKRTLESLLASQLEFELLVVDQSSSPNSQVVVEELADDRLRYLASPPLGLGAARNLALQEATGPILAMTDDDCVVSDDWPVRMSSLLNQEEHAALAFCRVRAAQAPVGGVIPQHLPRASRVHRSLFSWLARGGGIGAGMAVRRDTVLGLGGFNPSLGKGAAFGSHEDGDMAVRALLAGFSVVESDQVTVFHHGFVSHQQNQIELREVYRARGASLRQLRAGARTKGWLLVWDLGRILRLLPGRLSGRHQHPIRKLVQAYLSGLACVGS